MRWTSVFFTAKYSFLIFIGALIFLSVHKKRKFYFLRLLFPVSLIFCGSMLTSFLPYGNRICDFFRFFIMNALLFLGMLFCNKTNPSTVFFSCTAAMALQQFCAGLLSLIRLGISLGSLVANYYFRSILEELIVFTPFYILAFFLVASRLKGRNYDAINIKMKIMSATIVIICIGIYRFVDTSTKNGIIVSALYSMTCCAFALVIQFAFYQQSILSQNLVLEKKLRRQEINHYQNWRDSVEIINIKYHDLKHQIFALRKSSDNESWGDVEKALAIYDDMLKTGNDVLDTILSEKKMIGDKFGITMTCIVDGESLKFMRELDIYSLFGNALDNAMNAVKEVDDISKRNISVIVRRIGDAVIIHIENNFAGSVSFVDGLAQTSGDKNFHGYGMKSIKTIVDRYNGTMNMSSNDNLFALNIMIQSTKNKNETKTL